LRTPYFTPTPPFWQTLAGLVTAVVLKAFELSQSPANRYLRVNAFEAFVAIDFLDREVVQSLLRKPQLLDLNMVPVEDWPETPEIASGCGGRLSFREEDKQIVHEDVMSAKVYPD
jgi:hypothetical protein